MRENTTIRPATPDDMKELSAVVARAFEDDPLYEWFLPDAATRVAKVTALNEALFPRLMPIDYFETFTTSDRAGVAIWAGPEKWEPPTTALLGAMPKMLRTIGLRGAMRMVGALNTLKKEHPKDPHWYLMGLATDPPRQRTGVGSALVTPKLEACDREQLGAYLETQKAENVPYYQRFGFRVTKEIGLRKGPRIWLMWRDPQ